MYAYSTICVIVVMQNSLEYRRDSGCEHELAIDDKTIKQETTGKFRLKYMNFST